MSPKILRRGLRINKLFLLCVVFPTLLSAIYFGLIASDIFISESRFVVRSSQKQIPTGLSAIFPNTGFGRSQDDTYTVHDYIQSRDVLKKLEVQLAISGSFGSKAIDPFSRFGGLDGDNSFEALHRYYQKRVSIEVDGASSITVLRTSAFIASEAQRINEMLIDVSEKLVNQLNERGRQDMIRFAAAEVDVAEEKARLTALAMSTFRSQKSIFDPERQSAIQLQLVSKLQDELINTKTQLEQIRSLTKDNPQIIPLQKKLDILRVEITSETAKIAGGDRSLSDKSVDFERLALDRAFADKQLSISLASLEQARNDAQRKQLYLERIVQPSLPDMPVEPRRLRNVLATFVLGLIAWGIASMLIAGVREHQD